MQHNPNAVLSQHLSHLCQHIDVHQPSSAEPAPGQGDFVPAYAGSGRAGQQWIWGGRAVWETGRTGLGKLRPDLTPHSWGDQHYTAAWICAHKVTGPSSPIRWYKGRWHTTHGTREIKPLCFQVVPQPTPILHWIPCKLLSPPVPAQVMIMPLERTESQGIRLFE